MSKDYTIVITKEVALECIDWNALKLNFVSKHAAKGGNNKKSYSSVISALILDKYGSKMRVNDGKAVGRRWVSIYLQCSHGNKFLAQISRAKFVVNKNLEFILSRSSKGLKSCDCSKFKKYYNILFEINCNSFQKLIQLKTQMMNQRMINRMIQIRRKIKMQ